MRRDDILFFYFVKISVKVFQVTVYSSGHSLVRLILSVSSWNFSDADLTRCKLCVNSDLSLQSATAVEQSK